MGIGYKYPPVMPTIWNVAGIEWGCLLVQKTTLARLWKRKSYRITGDTGLSIHAHFHPSKLEACAPVTALHGFDLPAVGLCDPFDNRQPESGPAAG